MNTPVATLGVGPTQAALIELASLFAASRYVEAEAAARRMTETWPGYGIAWKALGAVLAAQAQLAEAMPALQKAVELLPADAETHNTLGNVLQRLGRFSESEASYRRAIELRPGYFEAHNNLGAELHALGRVSEAEARYRRAIELKPDYHEAHNNLGNALQVLGRAPEAEASCRRALALKPDYHEAHDNLGTALQALGRLPEAEASYRRAVELEPGFHIAYSNLGNVLQALGRSPGAEANYRRALALSPRFSLAHNNLGNVLQAHGRLSEAEASYRRAIEFKPGYHEAHNNLGNALQALGRLPEAEAAYRRALDLAPDCHLTHSNLGGALLTLGRQSEAEASFRRALELKSDDHLAHNNLGGALLTLGRPAEAQASYRRAMEIDPDYHEAHSNLIFALDLVEGCGIGEQQEERRRWYERYGRKHAASIRPHENLPDPGRKLRVGYVSADFCRHSASCVFGPLIRRHDRSAFEVFCYSGATLEDDVTRSIRQAAHAWRSTLGVSDDALAGQIRSDRIDILVDLSGHSTGNRLPVFARKPAPVQVTAWGHANGTGLETMDYFLGDPVAVPPEERSLYAEEIVDLPCIVCFEPPEYLPGVSPLPALGGRPFTFGCINRLEKISDKVIVLWGRILAEVPEAGLLVKGKGLDDPEQRRRFMSKLKAVGIAAERVRLAGVCPHAEHLKIHHVVDLGLDPFPHGGGVSSAEALWMGVPVVALIGSTVPGRVTASILTALQMQEWIAYSEEEYVRIAIEAARDLPRLARTREQLRSRLAESIFGDVQRYTRAVEACYRTLWRRWCAGDTATAGCRP